MLKSSEDALTVVKTTELFVTEFVGKYFRSYNDKRINGKCSKFI
jgi:hypothetical protein